MLEMLSKPKNATSKIAQVCIKTDHIICYPLWYSLKIDSNILNICNFLSADCKWNPWGQWGPCSETCGKGRQERTRSVNVTATIGGRQCEGSDTQSRGCNYTPCPSKTNHVLSY